MFKIMFIDNYGVVVLVKFDIDLEDAIKFITHNMWDINFDFMVVKAVNTDKSWWWTKEKLVNSYYEVGLDNVRSRLDLMVE